MESQLEKLFDESLTSIEKKKKACERARQWRISNPDKYAIQKAKLRAKQRIGPFPAICIACGISYLSRIRKGKFCSHKCNVSAKHKISPEWYQQNHLKNLDKHRAWSMKRYRRTREQTPWKILLETAKVRAKKKNLSFDLTNAWALARWTGCCELTGIPFASVLGTRSCFSPSLDQIQPYGGYTQDNCRFVLWAINAMKGADTDKEMYAIAKALVTNQK